MRNGRAVIFDCDGVLVDSEPLALEAFKQALVDQNIPYPTDRLWKFCGLSSHESMRIVLEEKRLPIRHRTIPQRQSQPLTNNWSTNAACKYSMSVRDLIKDLKEMGVTVAVATSGPHEKVQKSLNLTGLKDEF